MRAKYSAIATYCRFKGENVCTVLRTYLFVSMYVCTYLVVLRGRGGLGAGRSQLLRARHPLLSLCTVCSLNGPGATGRRDTRCFSVRPHGHTVATVHRYSLDARAVVRVLRQRLKIKGPSRCRVHCAPSTRPYDASVAPEPSSLRSPAQPRGPLPCRPSTVGCNRSRSAMHRSPVVSFHTVEMFPRAPATENGSRIYCSPRPTYVILATAFGLTSKAA